MPKRPGNHRNKHRSALAAKLTMGPARRCFFPAKKDTRKGRACGEYPLLVSVHQIQPDSLRIREFGPWEGSSWESSTDLSEAPASQVSIQGFRWVPPSFRSWPTRKRGWARDVQGLKKSENRMGSGEVSFTEPLRTRIPKSFCHKLRPFSKLGSPFCIRAHQKDTTLGSHEDPG